MISVLRKYLSRAVNLIKKPATGDAAFLYMSSLLSSGVGFVSSVLVARQLGPTEFAIVAGYNAIVMTLAGFTDFGLGTGLIRFTTPHLKKPSSKEAIPYFRFVFIVELVIGSLLLSLGLLFASFIPGLVGQSMSVETVRIAVIAASVTSAAAYVGAAMAAHKKFKLNAAISISISILKLAVIFLLWKLDMISVANVLLVYVVLSFLAAIVGFLAVPKDYLHPVAKDKLLRAGKNIFTFSGWLTLSFFITSVMGRLDFFYLYRLKGPSDAGVYAAAQQLSMVFSILVGAIGTVITPYISEKVTYKEKIRFLKKTVPLALMGAALFVFSLVFVPFLVEAVFGQKYTDAVQPLMILILSLAVNVLLIPITLMFIPLGKVQYGTLVAILQLATAFLLYPVMIGRYGANGAALTVLITALAALCIYPLVLFVLLRKEKRLASA